MAVNKQILNQYMNEKQEIIETRAKIERYENRIVRLEKRIAEIEEGHTVKDKVRGGEGGLQSFVIEGVPFEEYNDKLLDLAHAKRIVNQTKDLLHTHELNLILRTKEVEEFVSKIDDSLLRRIINLRVVDGLAWAQVAKKIGGGNTEASVKVMYSRFVDREM